MNRVISSSIATIIAITVMLSSCNSSEEKSNTEDKGIEETQKSIPSTQKTQATPAETKTKIETPLQLPQSNKTGGENTNFARNDTTDGEKSNKNKVEHSKNFKKTRSQSSTKKENKEKEEKLDNKNNKKKLKNKEKNIKNKPLKKEKKLHQKEIKQDKDNQTKLSKD